MQQPPQAMGEGNERHGSILQREVHSDSSDVDGIDGGAAPNVAAVDAPLLSHRDNGEARVTCVLVGEIGRNLKHEIATTFSFTREISKVERRVPEFAG